MMHRNIAWVGAPALLLVFALLWACSPSGSESISVSSNIETGGTTLNIAGYAEALAAFVDDEGMVDYQGLKADSTGLDAFLDSVGRLDPDVYAGWDDSEKMALWMNAYNAFTLRAILDRYPIKAGIIRGLAFPKNSIRQISGVWNKLQWTIMGEEVTLDDIEHKTLRPQFKDPRIHAALVCAAMGCPPLRNEPFDGKRVGDQLDDQMRDFLSHPNKFRIDHSSNTVYLSPILEWYGEDFVESFGTEASFAGHSKVERAVLNAIVPYLSESDRSYLGTQSFTVDYLDYDWSLNEQ